MKRVMAERAIFAVLGLLLIPVTLAAQVPAVNGPVCVPVPGIPCPGSSHVASIGSRGNLNSVVAGAFFQWLLSDDPKAAAKKQQMMQELQARQAEAERQHKTEEAARLAMICNRLSATLKLNGLPDLAMKDVGVAGGLHLKLGDSDNGHIGIRGLPGIALNDNTGNGGTMPYGNPGLPGIYTNSPGSGSAASVPADPALRLKTGDASPTPSASASSPGSSPSQLASADANPAADSAAGAINPRNMTPQQLADLATKIASLPPAEQQQLMDAAANAAKGTPAGAGAAGQPQPSASVAPSQPVASQLQRTAGASQAATTAATPEDAAALARTGFDTPAAGIPMPSSAGPVALSHSSGTPQVQLSATASPGSVAPHGFSTTSRLSLHTIPPPLPPGIDPAPSGARTLPGTAPSRSSSVAVNGACPHGFEKVIPTRQQLQTELAVERAQLESLQKTIMRFNRTIQLDQQQYAVWEDEAITAKKRVEDHLLSIIKNAAFDSFVDKKEEFYEDLENERRVTDFDKQQMSWLKQAKELKSFSDFKEWALTKQDNWEMLQEGARQLAALKTWSKQLPVNREIQSYIRCGEDLIDNAYDMTDLWLPWTT